MIAFDLECSEGHTFEGWFNDIASFEEQNAKGLITCPYCEDTRVRRVLSPVAIRSSSRPAAQGDQTIDYRTLAREVVHYINSNFENVGPNFAKEALKMHYGVKEKRNIRGAATEEEEKTLKEEGIEFFKIPVVKKEEDDSN
ncbi:MAG: DUF1178 family protein [Deltaproteobacteria bacterium]|nr:DUF1178 family protein [Deltaproteobacteria bacterium]